MSPITKSLVKGLQHAKGNAICKGDHQGSTAATLIITGIKLLPVPIVGVPLIIAGIFKALR